MSVWRLYLSLPFKTNRYLMESNFTPEQIAELKALIREVLKDVLAELLTADLNQVRFPESAADAPGAAAEK